MGDKEILRYLSLIDRRLEIITSGIDWKPEYAAEMEAIDRELMQLRDLVDAEHVKRGEAAGDGAEAENHEDDSL